MSFIQITVENVSVELSDILVAELCDLGFNGFEEKDGELVCSVAPADYDREATNAVFQRYGVLFREVELQDQNWNALWESNFEPVVVESFCAIRADFHPHFPDVEQEIIITPKMSFGTGHHATTYMMISQMQYLHFEWKDVADFGTGTGILAILAEKLGARNVIAIDEDDWSIENARENIARNGCSTVQLVKADSFTSDTKFDIILANINRNIILANLKPLTSSLKAGGFLLLSGLLASDETDMLRACAQEGLRARIITYKNNWISILAEHN